MNNEITKAFFEIMEITQKYHNANMAGDTIDPDTIDADAIIIQDLTRDILYQADESGEMLNKCDAAQRGIIDLIKAAPAHFTTADIVAAHGADITTLARESSRI